MPGDLDEGPEHGEREERRQQQPPGAPEQTTIGEARRHERTGLVAIYEVVDAVEPARVAGCDRGRDRASEVQRERAVVGVEGIRERRARVEAMAGFQVYEPWPGPRVDLQRTRQRHFATQVGDRVQRS